MLKKRRYKHYYSKTGYYLGKTEVNNSWIDNTKAILWTGIGIIPLLVGLFYMLNHSGIISWFIKDASLPQAILTNIIAP